MRCFIGRPPVEPECPGRSPIAAKTYAELRQRQERRPYLFSDSQTRTEFGLTREVLSYHLETLTSRSEEATFERFARKLAEAEICPNLRPNTGPTGGGDSKADTETYPVGEEVALRWYYGEQAAASERWAFAFSTKKLGDPKFGAM
jgi:hypothetical protein